MDTTLKPVVNIGYIYKITNLVNNKIYIGQTKRTEPERWQQHIWHAYNNPSNDCVALCNAIKKYGRHNFKREIIEKVDFSLLDEREIYWINYYDSMNPDIGYNICPGGGGHLIYSDEEIINAYTTHQSFAEAERHAGIRRGTISRRLAKIEATNKITIRKNIHCKIYQYDLNGNFIQEFNNITEASKLTGVGIPSICSKEAVTACGFIFIREGEDIKDKLSKLSRCNPKLQQVEQYDLDGNYIQTFDSAAEAAKKTKISVSNIKQASMGQMASGGGYLWRRVYQGPTYQEMIDRYAMSQSCCAVEELDANGNVIGEFESPKKADEYYGFGRDSTARNCRYDTTIAHGHYFRYKNARKRELLLAKINKT